MFPLQEKMLVLLKEINAVCMKYGIQWLMMYGTLLGAVRHKGFIPWDDDADIIMTHENWVRFKQAFAKENLPHRKLTGIDVDASQYGVLIMRYHDTSQEILLKNNTIFNNKDGIYIDILILDYYPDNITLRKNYYNTLLDCGELAHKRYNPTIYIAGVSKYRIKIFIFLLQKRNDVLNKYIQKLSSIGNTTNREYIQRYVIDHRYPKHYIDDYIYLPFEDTHFPAPKYYYDVLCLQYGEEWMRIPKNKVIHEDNIICEVTNHISIVNQFHQLHDSILHELIYFCSKFINIGYNFAYRNLQINKLILIAEFVKYQLKFETDKNLFYLSFQIHTWFIGRYVSHPWWKWYKHANPTFIDVEQQIIIDSLTYLLTYDNLQLACMILQAMKFSHYTMTPALIRLDELITTIKQCYSSLFAGNYSAIFDITEKALYSWPENLFLWRLRLWAGYLANPAQFTLPDNLPLHVAQDGEIALIRSELALRNKDLEKAVLYLRLCVGSTRNGLLLRRAKEIGLKLTQQLSQETLPRKEILEDLSAVLDAVPFILGEAEQTQDSVTKDPTLWLQQFPVLPSASQNIVTLVQKKQSEFIHKQYELLCELAELCEACGVRYYLFGSALRFAVNKWPLGAENIRLCLAIELKEVEKLLTTYQAHILPHRYLECSLTNPDCPEFAFYYGDDTTLELNLSTYGFFQKHGIFIWIRVLFPEKKHAWRQRLHILTEKTWIMEHGYIPVQFVPLMWHYFLSCLRLLFGKQRVMRWLWHKIFSTDAQHETTNYTLYWQKNFLLLPKIWFHSNHTATLEGKKFPAPNPTYLNKLLTKIAGKKWNIQPQAVTEVDPFHLVSLDTSFENFASYLQTTKCDLQKLWRERLKLLLSVRGLFQQKLDRDWEFLQFLNERYVMYKKVLPLKKQLLFAQARGDEKQLNNLFKTPIMKTCLSAINKYFNQGLCFNFDSEIFNVILEQMSKDAKNAKKVQQLRKMNKTQHYPLIKPEDLSREEF